MVNQTTRAFRRMMINGRLNKLMTEAVQDGIEATALAKKTIKWERPLCMLPKVRVYTNSPDNDSEFEIPECLIKDKTPPSD